MSRALAPAARAAASAARGAGAKPPTPKWKIMLYTATFTAVTVTGTIYGAGLKTQQEWQSEKQKAIEATLEEKIALLEGHRVELVRLRGELEHKLDGMRERMQAIKERTEARQAQEAKEAQEAKGGKGDQVR